MKLVKQYIAFFFNFSTTSNHLHPLQVENCDSNSRLVVDEDDNGKFRVERVKPRKSFFSLNISVVLRNTDIFMWSHTGGVRCCYLVDRLIGVIHHRGRPMKWQWLWFVLINVKIELTSWCSELTRWNDHFANNLTRKKRSYLR